MGLSEARARFPDLDVLEADMNADAALLEAIADWCDRYTPLVALDPPHGLVLDISGCAHLFGGEKALMDDLLARLFHQGFAAHAAIAGHAGTALAMVTGRQVSAMASEGEEGAAIEGLSVAALRLGDKTTAMLERLGLKTIGTLLTLPRQSLSRRFGAGLMVRLDEAAGRASRPISPRLPVPVLIAERRFAQPISLVEDVERILLHLADRIGADLERRCEGARRLRLSLFRVDGKVVHVEVAASRPIRLAERVHALFRERLKGLGDELDSGFGYDCIKLSVLAAEAMTERQEDLAGERYHDDDLRSLLDRIAARLGECSVLGLSASESHRPERAAGTEPAARLDASPGDLGGALSVDRPQRPLRLLESPEAVEAVAEVPEGPPMRFRWRRALHTVKRCEGPERIASEWWRNDAGETRDYYRIEDEEGRRYWLFREGFYGAETPAWYLHGLFA